MYVYVCVQTAPPFLSDEFFGVFELEPLKAFEQHGTMCLLLLATRKIKLGYIFTFYGMPGHVKLPHMSWLLV